MVAGAIIRMQCYREMGKNFTLQVTILKEHKLIMSGPYSYVRHPSYTGIYLCFAGMTIWCVVQGSWLRESEVYKVPLAWLALAPVMINILLIAAAPFRRIPTEDEMLKKTFGKEWDEWARKVPARLVPGIYWLGKEDFLAWHVALESFLVDNQISNSDMHYLSKTTLSVVRDVDGCMTLDVIISKITNELSRAGRAAECRLRVPYREPSC